MNCMPTEFYTPHSDAVIGLLGFPPLHFKCVKAVRKQKSDAN